MNRTPAEDTSGSRSGVVSRPRLTVALASGAFFLTTLDVLIINVALARIGDDLGGGTAALQWVVDGYTLLYASLLLFAGNLSDRIGARRTLALGVVGFAAMSLACALAPTITVLVISRCGQGAAAALMLPASMALIRQAFPDPVRRAHALGIWTAGGAVATAAGPLLGGILTTLNWRLVFWVNLPVGLLMLLLLPLVGRSPRHPAPFDWAGQLSVIIGLTGLIAGLIEGGAVGYRHPAVITALIIGGLGLTGFVIIQARGRHPMMPLSLFRPTGVRIALLGGFAFITSWFGTVFMISLYLQQERALSPLFAGLAFVPAALVSLIGNLSTGPLTARFGTRVPTVLGLAMMTLGLILLIIIVPYGSAWLIAAVTVLVGAGGSVAMPPITGLMLTSVGADRAGIAGAVLNTFRQVGGALAIAVFGVLISTAAGFTAGMRTSLLIAAVIGAAATLACTRIRHRPDQRTA